jgi:hypothetical protein
MRVAEFDKIGIVAAKFLEYVLAQGAQDFSAGAAQADKQMILHDGILKGECFKQ